MKHIKSAPPFITVISILCAMLLASGCQIMPPEIEKEQKIIVYPEPPDQPRFYYEQTLTSSLDVIKEDEDQRISRWLTGGGRSGIGMSKPFGIAVHQGRIFVTDTVARTVFVFDKPKGEFFRIGADELRKGRLVSPMGVEVDDEGNVYVFDTKEKKVFIYDRDGKFKQSLLEGEQLDRPTNLTVSPDGTRLYIVDTGGVRSQNHRIRVYDAISGEHIKDIGTRGKGPLEFNLPRDAAIGPNGLLHVLDAYNFRVQVIDPDTGELVRSFGSIGRKGGQFARPKSIAIDHQGNIYVSDAVFGNFQIFNSEGQLLMAIGSFEGSAGPGVFLLPSGIAVDEDGRVYMLDEYYRKIEVFRPAAIGVDQGYLAQDMTIDPESAAKE